MIGRFWHGWTTLENAGDYERIVVEAVERRVFGRDFRR